MGGNTIGERTRYLLQHVEAMKAIELVAGELARRKKAAVVAVSDSHGELIALLRVGDPAISTIRIAMNKAWTAAREREPSAAVGQAARDTRSGYDIAYFGDDRYVGWGGGVPLWRDGHVVGAIGVSGLDESEDVELAELGATAIEASQ